MNHVNPRTTMENKIKDRNPGEWVLRVIQSCKTEEQLETAKRLVNLYERKSIAENPHRRTGFDSWNNIVFMRSQIENERNRIRDVQAFHDDI
jgi:hypothetical protein